MTLSMLGLGFLLGLRHALEADHVAAVAALSTRSTSRIAAVRLAASWGVGHMMTILLLGSAAVLVSARLPVGGEAFVEHLVGFVLVLLGLDVIRRVFARRIHVHEHSHEDTGPHLHLHVHDHAATTRHEHAHGAEAFAGAFAPGGDARALAMGTLHGLGGSGALLVMLPAAEAATPASALAGLLLCGLGSVAGMVLFSALLFCPLQNVAGRLGMRSGLEGALGALSVLVGGVILAG